MSTKQDYYKILNVSRDAAEDEIKKAYRQAALNYHPDRNPGDKESEEKFKLASEAYEVLSDPQKREIYDHYGHAGLSGTDFHPFRDVEDVFASFGDIFEDFFGFGGIGRGGTRGTRRRVQRGDDFRYDLTIDFLEAYHGCEREIKFNKDNLCEECEGKGYPAYSKPSTCPSCHGRGQVYHSQGFFTISTTCSSCHGQGTIVKVLCKVCEGQGRIRKEKQLKVKIPAGVDTGNRLVLKGEGGLGEEGGPAGDLYVVISVKPHEFFKREGLDIWIDLPVSFAQAALGDTFKVPTVDGEEDIAIPKGIEAGETVQLKGKGFPKIHGKEHGNQIFRIVLKTPKHLTHRQEELLREFAEEEKEHPSSKKGDSKSKKKHKFFWEQ
jgi:molecular chaperone DnaJ